MADSVIIFRQDTKSAQSRPVLFKEFWRGYLRQGWGWYKTFKLIEDGREQFIRNYSRLANSSKKEARRIYQKLKWMLDIRPGDTLIVPSQPLRGQCTIMRATTGYRFIRPLDTGESENDFRHCIGVDPASVKVFRREMVKKGSLVDRAIWGGKGYQGPVNFVRKPDTLEALIAFAKLSLQAAPDQDELPDEPDLQSGSEGKKKVFYGTRMERDGRLRRAAVKYHGHDCQVCGFNFGKVYGDHGEGFIHVHHLRPLSEFATPGKVKVRKDLSVVCVNCHVMIHRRRKRTLTLSELRAMLRPIPKPFK